MIFLTTGTIYPFERLVKSVDELLEKGGITEEVVGQVGKIQYEPKNFEYFDVVPRERFDEYIRKARLIISHAGMGSIITATNLQKPTIVMPRLKKYKENINDHQLDTALQFEKLGVVMVANDAKQLAEKIALADNFVPVKRQDDSEQIASRIKNFINTVIQKK